LESDREREREKEEKSPLSDTLRVRGTRENERKEEEVGGGGVCSN